MLLRSFCLKNGPISIPSIDRKGHTRRRVFRIDNEGKVSMARKGDIGADQIDIQHIFLFEVRKVGSSLRLAIATLLLILKLKRHSSRLLVPELPHMVWEGLASAPIMSVFSHPPLVHR